MISSFKDLSIGRKISLVLTLTTLMAMAAMGTAVWQFQSRSYQENLEANLLSTARIIADNSASSIIFEDPYSAREILGSLKNIPGFSSAVLHDKDNLTLATQGMANSQPGMESMKKWMAQIRHERDLGTSGFVVFGDGRVFVVQPISYDGAYIGDLHMIFSLDPLVTQRIHLARYLVLVFMGTLLLTIFVGHRFQRWISRPLNQLARTAMAISKEKNYALRVDISSRDETGQLTESFNKMLDTIQLHEKNQIEAIQEADRVTRAKSQFLANMSHEIRTPMNGIIGMTDLMMETELSADQQESLEIIHSSADQLLTIINEILDYSKVESGNVVLDEEPLELGRIIEGVMKMISPTAERKGLTIKGFVDEDAPRWVSGDPARLRQILINLVGNSVKFTEKGEIEIRVRSLLTEESSAKLRFEVIDQGIGIPADQQEKIFTNFTQVDDSSTRSYGGTGLGLAICKLFIELMGGEIGVNSVVGDGSTFWFEIEMPVLKIETFIDEMHEGAKPGLSTVKECKIIGDSTGFPLSNILVAEDNKTNQIVISRTLKKLGCHVDIAENGQECVAMLKAATTPYDLVFMDCHMPVMDGYQATGIIRRIPGYLAKTPIIALTASAMAEDRTKALDAKMDDYLTKPLSVDMLRESLNKWVWGSRDNIEQKTATVHK